MTTTTLDNLIRHTEAKAKHFRLTDDQIQDALVHAWLRWQQEGSPDDNLSMYAYCGVKRARAGRGVPGAKSNGSVVSKDAMRNLNRVGEFRMEAHGNTGSRSRRPDDIAADKDAVAFLMSHQVIGRGKRHMQRTIWELTLEGWTPLELARKFRCCTNHIRKIMRLAPAL